MASRFASIHCVLRIVGLSIAIMSLALYDAMLSVTIVTSHTAMDDVQRRVAQEPSPLKAAIPHKLVFLDTRYTAPEKMPKHFYDNIMQTASHYREAWNEPNAPMWFLGNKECRQAINATEPRLLPFFDKEQRGQNLANICRIAALYLSGGYYFDTDMQSVKAVELEPDTVFSTPKEYRGKGLFNSFIASVPQHPVLDKALEVMLGYYHGKVKLRSPQMGTSTLKDAFEAVPEQERGKTFVMDEIHLKNDPHYRDIPRNNGTGCCCDFVVEDKTKKQIHFYSRMVGAGSNCDFPVGDPRRTAEPPAPKRQPTLSRLDKILCKTQELPDPVHLEKEMKEARALSDAMAKRCKNGVCRMSCGDKSNYMVPQPPKGTLLNINQVTAVLCALDIESKQLGRPANLLVWGLGNDSSFWANATLGRVAFIEDNAKWFSNIQKSLPGLEQYLVSYDTILQRDLSRFKTAEFEQQVDHVLDPWHLQHVVWDVILVDAPNGCTWKDVGRFAPIYTSKRLVTRQGHGHVFVDDYQRTPERNISDFVLDGSSSSRCPPLTNCGKRVAVSNRIHPASRQYIEKLAMFSFGSSVTDNVTSAILKIDGWEL